MGAEERFRGSRVLGLLGLGELIQIALNPIGALT